MSRVKVSVLMASHDCAGYIDECLDSILGQDYPDFEVIVCDDCSVDGTYERLLERQRCDVRIKVLRNSTNKRQAFSLNRCYEESSGEYLMLHDADDMSLPNRMGAQVDVLERERGIAFVSCAMRLFDESNPSLDKVVAIAKEYPTKLDFLGKQPFHHPATMLRRDCFDAVGGYRVCDETRRNQDFDLYARLYAAGFKGKNMGEALYLYRENSGAVARRSLDSRKSEFDIRKSSFKVLGLMPLAAPFLLRPYLAHAVQCARLFIGKTRGE